jgi:hypothetical protein
MPWRPAATGSVDATVFIAGSILEMARPWYAVVQTDPSATTAKSGSAATVIVAVGASVAGSRRVTVPGSLGTHTEPKPNATSSCSPGTTARALTVALAASILVTAASPKSATQTDPSAYPIPIGRSPAWTRATTRFVCVSILATSSDALLPTQTAPGAAVRP